MAKVIQIIDVDSEGHKVRLDDGNVIRMPHGGPLPHIGEEVELISYVHQQPMPAQWEPADDLLHQARWATKQDSPSLDLAGINSPTPEPAA